MGVFAVLAVLSLWTLVLYQWKIEPLVNLNTLFPSHCPESSFELPTCQRQEKCS